MDSYKVIEPPDGFIVENDPFDKMYDVLVSKRYEGGLADGGTTNKGMEQASADNYFKNRGLPTQNVADMDDTGLKKIYREDYYENFKIDKIPYDKIRHFVFHFGVNFYPTHTIKMIQEEIGTKVDGKIGPDTLDSLNKYIDKYGEDQLLEKSLERARQKYEQILKDKPIKEKNRNGWMNRIKHFREDFLSFINPFSVNEAHAEELFVTEIPEGFEIEEGFPEEWEVLYEPVIEKAKEKGIGDKVAFFVNEALIKSPLRGVKRLPSSLESLWQIGLDQLKGIAKEQLRDDGAVFGVSDSKFMNRTTAQQDRIDRNNEIIRQLERAEDVSSTLQADWERISESGFTARDPDIWQGDFMENPSWTRAVALGMESLPILGLATITSGAVGVGAGATMIGTIEAAPMYQEMRKQGFSEAESLTMFAVNTAVLSVLESVPLTGFLKGGSLPVRVIRGIAQEGGEEVAQGLWMNAVEKLGWNDTKDLYEGLIESFIAGGISGGLIGGLSPSRIQKINTDVDKAKQAGVDVDALLQTIPEIVKANEDKVIDKTKDAMIDLMAKDNIVRDETGKPIEIDPTPQPTEGAGKLPPTPPKPTAVSPGEEPLKHSDKSKVSFIDRLNEKIKDIEEGVPYATFVKNQIKSLEKELSLAKKDKNTELVKAIQSDIDTLKEDYSGLKPQSVTMTERANLKQRISDIKTGLREGTIQTKKDIKAVQDEAINLLSDAELDLKDKGRFINTVKNIQTEKQLDKAMPIIEERIAQLEEKSEKRALLSDIKKVFKQAKPKKSGSLVKGKYDYETNKFFDKLKNTQKLSKEDAAEALSIYPTDNLTPEQAMEARLLSVRANQMESSVDMLKQVKADLENIQRLGKMAKGEQDLLKAVNLENQKTELQERINNVKGGIESLGVKIKSSLTQLVGNTYSVFNAIAGKEFADVNDPENLEKENFTNVYFKEKDLLSRVKKAYGIEKDIDLSRKISEMSNEKIRVIDTSGVSIEINKNQILDIYNSIKNDLLKERYLNLLGQETLDSLLSLLTEQDRQAADIMQEVVQTYFPVYNQYNIEKTGRDLGRVDNYWPATSEFEAEVFAEIHAQSSLPSAIKKRVESSKVIPRPKDAWTKAKAVIREGEHIRTLSREYERLKTLFTDRRIRETIKEKYGDNIYNFILDRIEKLSRNNDMNRASLVTSLIGQGVNNAVTAKIALSPSVYFRQLGSVINYAENMPSGQWFNGFLEGVTKRKETFKFMWENSPYLEARYNKGYSEAINEAIKGANELSISLNDWRKTLTAWSRNGDITAIIYGGYPVIKYQMSQGKTKEQAFKIFEEQTIKAQQSGLVSGLSELQSERTPYVRIFTSFKNTASQYTRKMVEATEKYNNGEIGGDQLVKTYAIYGVYNAILYVLLGYLPKKALDMLLRKKRKEKEDVVGDMVVQVASSPFLAIPFVDDIAEYAVRKALKKNTYQMFTTPFFNDLQRASQRFNKKNISFKDFIDIVGVATEVSTSLPAGKIIKEAEETGINKQIERFLRRIK